MVVAERSTRGNNYSVNIYRVEVTRNMRERALDFATRIIRTNNQYSRLLPSQVWESNDLGLREKLEIQRTYVGKIGEMVFLDLLGFKNKNVNTDGMFEIYEGQENVDDFDFITLNDESVDVKTGFRVIHSRLLINVEQFNNLPKDYYVGVKLNGVDVDAANKIIDLNSITEGIVYGYAEYDYLNNHANEGNYGEGPAKALPYNRLLGIDRLIDMFWVF